MGPLLFHTWKRADTADRKILNTLPYIIDSFKRHLANFLICFTLFFINLNLLISKVLVILSQQFNYFH